MTFDDFVAFLSHCAGSEQINLVQVKQSSADIKAKRSRYDATYLGKVFVCQIYKKKNGSLGAAYIVIPGLNRNNGYENYTFKDRTYRLDNGGHLKVKDAIENDQLSDIIKFVLSQISGRKMC